LLPPLHAVGKAGENALPRRAIIRSKCFLSPRGLKCA